MVHLIVGYGEVGKSLGKVLGDHLWTSTSEGTWKEQDVDVVHICFPYTYADIFNNVVSFYKTKAKLVIVHSSVPVGTCGKLGVVHSPIHGVHPHLEKGIRTFPKTFGGTNRKDVLKAAKIFKDLGIKTRTYRNAETTEALKLWSTTQYGRLIMLEKEIHEWCEQNNIDFNAVYTQHNQDYNEAYLKLGRPEVIRPWLKHMDGPIGGHCILPNSKLLEKPILTKVLISGGWDLMHYNHIKTLELAKKYGNYLIVNVLTDERMRFKKGKERPLIPLKERMFILENIKGVDEVVSVDCGTEYPLFEAIKQYKPDYVLINTDEQADITKEQEFAKQYGTEVVAIPRIDDGVSTTKLLERFRKN